MSRKTRPTPRRSGARIAWPFRSPTVTTRRCLPRVESLEARLTPTTLLPGFTEATVVSGLTAPTAMEFAPDGRLFVLEQGGNVKLVRGDGTTWTALHLNVDSSGERGLLGIAFDPAFATDHYAYLYYTNPNPGASTWATGEHNQLSRFTVNDAIPAQPVLAAEAPILDWDNLSAATNHNGGAIHFGLDGMLYADAGDNVQTFTQGGNTYRVSQTLSNLLGKQLRIDVSAFNSGAATRDDTAVGHLIPGDNPFVNKAAGINRLIYALGLRNPYTFAVQPGTGKIFINDVGETTWEEIDQSAPGANFGWSGGNTDGFGHSNPPGPGAYHDPLLAYNHSGGPAGGGIAIVGGTFYNPAVTQFPAGYAGKYFYEDLGAGWIRVFDPSNPGTAANPDTSSAFASGTPGALRDLKVDAAGSLYYLSGTGVINKITYTPPSIAYVIGADDQVYTHAVDASGKSIGGYIAAGQGPVKELAVSRFGGGTNVEAFVVGTDNQVEAETFDSGNHSRGYFGTAYGSVASVSAGTDINGKPLLFAVSTADDHGQLYELKFDTNGNPTSARYTKATSGNFKSTVLTHDSAGNPLLYAIGQDDQVYGLKLNGAGTPVGGLFKVSQGPVKELTVGQVGGNIPEIFVAGTDGSVNSHKLDGSGSPIGNYVGFGGPLRSISVTRDVNNVPELFGVGGDGQVYGHKFDAGGNPTGSFFKVSTAAVPGGAKSTYAGVDPNTDPVLYVVSSSDDQVYAAPFDAAGDPSGPFTLSTPGAVKKVVLA